MEGKRLTIKISHFRPDTTVLFSHSVVPISLQPHRLHAAAKSHQSCLTLCNPIDGSPPGCISIDK